MSPNNEQLGFQFEADGEHIRYAAEDQLVLSLQPYAFDLIFSGEKKMEYRTRFRKNIVEFLFM